jgi:molybdopterin-guanine dinucleotide biosynthesis protein A
MQSFLQVEAAILTGGKSSRMGLDKAFLEIAGMPILQRTANLLAPLVAGITLVTSAASANARAAGNPPNPMDGLQGYARFGLPTCADRWPGAGPLGGIATALGSARAPWCLILACDLPYLTADWLAYLLGKTDESVADAIVPETSHGLEPLCGVYRTSSTPAITAALESGLRKVTDAFENLSLERVPESEWRRFSPDRSLFHNMNTWQDYQQAKERIKK